MLVHTRRNIVVALWLVGLAAPAIAQTMIRDDPGASPAEIMVAMTLQGPGVIQAPLCGLLSISCAGPTGMPDFGGSGGLAMNRSDHVALVGEAAAGIANGWSANQRPSPPANHVHAVLFGTRVKTSLVHLQQARLRLFGQVLTGGEWGSVTAVSPKLQPGAGLDFYRDDGTTIRIEADYSWVPGVRSRSSGRLLFGFVIPVR